jgi:hypothetical protein
VTCGKALLSVLAQDQFEVGKGDMQHILIPRAHLFGNPGKISAQISPDGRLLAWPAPADGVLNVWVGPSEAPELSPRG